MGLSNLLSNLPILITVVLLIVSVVMFFYFRQKISELEKASVSQAKVLHSFISQSLAMPRNYNPSMQLSSHTQEPPMILSNNSESNGYELINPKEKIVVSDDEEDDEYDDTSSSDDDSSSSSNDSDNDSDEEPEKVKKIKIQEVDETSDIIEHLDTSKVKKIFLNSENENNLVPFEIHNDGSCDSSQSDDELSDAGNDSLSELSDNEDDDRITNNDLSNTIHVTKLSENKPIESILTNLTNNDTSNINVSNLSIVKKSTSLNTSLKDKEEGSELKALKVDTLRQLVIDKSLVNNEEAKKLKKKELVELLAQVEKKDNV